MVESRLRGKERVTSAIPTVCSAAVMAVSIARMQSPPGWQEPRQTQEFDEYTVVLRGMLRVETRQKVLDLRSGQAVIIARGEWMRYSTPGPDEAEYLAIRIPGLLTRNGPPYSV